MFNEFEDWILLMIISGIGAVLPVGTLIICFIADFISLMKTGKFRTKP